jgi:hypothetical protein
LANLDKEDLMRSRNQSVSFLRALGACLLLGAPITLGAAQSKTPPQKTKTRPPDPLEKGKAMPVDPLEKSKAAPAKSKAKTKEMPPDPLEKNKAMPPKK